MLGVAYKGGRRRPSRVAGAEDHPSPPRARRRDRLPRPPRRRSCPTSSCAPRTELEELAAADLACVVTAHPEVDHERVVRRPSWCSTSAASPGGSRPPTWFGCSDAPPRRLGRAPHREAAGRPRSRWAWRWSPIATAGTGDRLGGRPPGPPAARSAARAPTALKGAEQRLGSAGRATQDTVAVLVEGYEATPQARDGALQPAAPGFRVRLRAGQALDRGHPPGLVAGGQCPGRRPPHPPLRSRDPDRLRLGPPWRCSPRTERLEQALAVPFGAGIGLTFDEAALLLDLRDVYWTREGLLSVQLSLGIAGHARRDDPRPEDASPGRGAGRGGGADPRRRGVPRRRRRGACLDARPRR